MPADGVFSDDMKATTSSPPENLTRWITTQSKQFTKKFIKMVSKAVWAVALKTFITWETEPKVITI